MVAPPREAQPLVVDDTLPPESDPRVGGFGSQGAARPAERDELFAELGLTEVVIPDTREARQDARELFARVAASDARARRRAEAPKAQAPVP